MPAHPFPRNRDAISMPCSSGRRPHGSFFERFGMVLLQPRRFILAGNPARDRRQLLRCSAVGFRQCLGLEVATALFSDGRSRTFDRHHMPEVNRARLAMPAWSAAARSIAVGRCRAVDATDISERCPLTASTEVMCCHSFSWAMSRLLTCCAAHSSARSAHCARTISRLACSCSIAASKSVRVRIVA